MTARDVTIALRARTGQYERAIRGATAQTLKLGGAMSGLGGKAAIGGVAAVTSGVIALGSAAAVTGAAGAALFAPYEKSLSKITGLVGVAREQVEEFDVAIRDISEATARGPQELADALFFITSAGLEGQDAIDALRVSAEAATAGLGDTAVIADVVTSAVNAYGESLGGAGVATDVLVAAVREGKAEAPALASSLGRVIPIASQMGISFDQVGAAIAAMTRTGLDANEAATALRGIMNSLLAPTTQAAEALGSVGLSAQGLRQQIRDQGLFSTLQSLAEAFEGNEEATTAVFGNVRALTGVLSLMGSNADATRGIFDELAASTGSLDDAFGAATDTDSFRIEQAINDIKVALLDVGEEVLPLIADTVDEIAPLLPDLVAGLGDVAEILFTFGADAAKGFTTAMGNVEQAIRGVQIVALDFKEGGDQVVDVLDFLQGPLINYGELWSEADERQRSWLQTQAKVQNGLRAGASDSTLFSAALLEMVDAQTLNQDTAASLVNQLNLTDEAAGRLAQSFLQSGEVSELTAAQAYELVVFLGDYLAAVEEANARGAEHEEQMWAQNEAARAAANATEQVADAATGSTGPLGDIATALDTAAAAGRSYATALLELTNPTFKAQQAVGRLRDAEAAAADVRDDRSASAEEIAEAELAVVSATLEAQAALDAISPGGLEASIRTVQEVLGTSRDEAADLLEVLGILDRTTASPSVVFDTSITGPAAGAIQGRGDLLFGGPRAMGGPVAPGRSYLVGEQEPELFVPKQAGTIVPVSQIDRSDHRSRSVVLNVYGTDQPEQTAESLLLMAQIGAS